MKEKEMICESCGRVIVEKKRKNYEYKYCSYSCYYDGRYGKNVVNEKLKSRNPAYIEASKLIKQGYTQRKAAEEEGVKFYAFRDWLTGNSKVIYADAVCRYCGEKLSGMKNIGNRKYCSVSCGTKANYHKKHPKAQTRQRHAQRVLEKAYKLYRSGLRGKAIALRLGIPKGTVYSWIHDFGEGNVPHLLMTFTKRLRSCETADEWHEALRAKISQNSENESGKSIRLVCETVHIWSVTLRTADLKSVTTVPNAASNLLSSDARTGFSQIHPAV